MTASKISYLAVAMLIDITSAGCALEDSALVEQHVSPDQSASLQSTGKFSHCVVSAVAQPQKGAPPTNIVPPQPECFETFTDAMFAATKGRVQLPASSTIETIDDGVLNGGARPLSDPFVIAVEYSDANFQGSTLTIRSDVSCLFFDLSVSSMPAGWNDIISSAKAFASCNRSTHFEHVNFGGASVNCGTGCAFIGAAMNDRTSSIRWSLF